MNDKISIVIADDDRTWCEVLKNQLEQYSFFEVTGMFCNGQKALECIQRTKPDVVLLDMVMPGADGLYIVSRISDCMEDYDPFVCIVSAIGTAKTNKLVKNLKVDYYFVKPVSTKIVAENIFRLLSMNGTVQGLYGEAHPNIEEETPAFTIREKDFHQVFDFPLTPQIIEDLVVDYLNALYLNMNLSYTKVIGEAIQAIVLNGSGKMMSLYREVAEAMPGSANAKSVERAVRYGISVVRRQDSPLARELFGDKERLVNSEFLYISEKYIRSKIKKSFGERAYARVVGQWESDCF